VYIVDNGSADESVARIEGWRRGRADRDRFIFLRSAANLGFSGGNNLGIRRALEDGAELIWLLNNDTAPAKDALTALVRASLEDEAIGIVGSLILYKHDPETINSAGILVSPFSMRARLLGLNERRADPRFNTQRDVDAVSGCSMLLRTSALRRVGLMEERYFLYFEELDLALRLKKAGYRCVFAPESVILHKQWGSIQPYPELADYYLPRSQVLFTEKFAGKAHAAAAIVWFAARYFPRVVIRSVRIKNFACLRAFGLGLWHGLVGRFDYRWPMGGASR
jgi:GT2 family glycosyltransferase